jgi:long-chain fatty acid transport protein
MITLMSRVIVRRSFIVSRRFIVAAVLLGLPGESAAQTNSEVNAGIQFDFPLPGARSLGMAGAFVAVADDATAAVANPAGLSNLARPEVSGEVRGWRFTSVTPSDGHAFGPPTNVGVDSIAGVVDSQTSQNTAGVSFLSAVFPAGRFAVGIYRHEQAQFRANVLSDGPFISTQGQTSDRLPPFTGTIGLDIVNYGVSLAYRVAGGLTIGGGAAFSDFSLNSRTSIYFYDPFGVGVIQPPSNRVAFTGAGQTFGAASFVDSNRLGDIVETGTDHGAAFNFGVLFRPTGEKWSAGGAVRLNPEFHYQEASRWGPAQPDPAARGTLIAPPITVAFKVPDVYSIGGSFRATDVFLVAAQFDRVRFSQLSRDLQDVNGTTGGEAHLAVIQGLRLPDSNQIRFGTEYALVRANRVVSLRAGTAYESGHQMTYTQTTPTDFARLDVLYPPNPPGQWHVTAGVGLAFATSFQVDAGVDVSKRTPTISVSSVYRF